jgi:early endosome antigen 1
LNEAFILDKSPFSTVCRNSIDDAAVLKQELVSVQKMMDKLSLEKDKEIDDLNKRLLEMENASSDSSKREDELKKAVEQIGILSGQLQKMQNQLESSNIARSREDSKHEEEIERLNVELNDVGSSLFFYFPCCLYYKLVFLLSEF